MKKMYKIKTFNRVICFGLLSSYLVVDTLASIIIHNKMMKNSSFNNFNPLLVVVKH